MENTQLASDISVGAGASATPLNGAINCMSSPERWSPALIVLLNQKLIAERERASSKRARLYLVGYLTVNSGAIGVGGLSSDGVSFILQEQIFLPSSQHQKFALEFDRTDELPAVFMIRNTASTGASEFTLNSFELVVSEPLVLDDVGSVEWFPAALKHPARARTILSGGSEPLTPLNLKLNAGSLVMPKPDQLWTNPVERVVLQSALELIEQLADFDTTGLGNHIASVNTEQLRHYLYMNVVRVVNLVEILQSFGVSGGTLLEVGSYFGSFALPLQRLGFRVTAIDRYEEYGDAFTRYVDLMSAAGVTILNSNRTNEEKVLANSGEFDTVISCAVIEHIPHTPRLFLESLSRAVKIGGLLAIDTPNLTRYWNRRNMAEGKSVYQPIDGQYHTEIPFEGHHREYTGGELTWMMQQVGMQEIVQRYFDYNPFQFKSLEDGHIDCLLNVIAAPELADVILTAGRKR